MFAKGRKSTTNVIPAKAGIQKYQTVRKALDPGFRRGDDFLRNHQICCSGYYYSQKYFQIFLASKSCRVDQAKRIHHPLQEAPEIGETKKGDLTGVSVHRFKVRERLFLLAYEIDEEEVLLFALGAHENFYRDLKRHLA